MTEQKSQDPALQAYIDNEADANKKSYDSAEDRLLSLKEDLSTFVGNAPQSDDITFVIISHRLRKKPL